MDMSNSNLLDVYYINLDRCVDRRKQFEKTFSNRYRLHRISAYDGAKGLSNYTDIKIPSLQNSVSSSCEVACSLSHVKAIWTAFKEEKKWAIIMEDDAANDYVHIWGKNQTLLDIANRSPSDAECIQFSCVNADEISKMISMKTEFSKYNIYRYGTTCYLVRLAGMKKIISQYITTSGKIDLQKVNKINRFTADCDIIYPVLNTYNYNFPTIHHNLRQESTIHPDHGNIHKCSEYTIKKWFSLPSASKVYLAGKHLVEHKQN